MPGSLRLILLFLLAASASFATGQAANSASKGADDSIYAECQKTVHTGAEACTCEEKLYARRDAELNAVYQRALVQLGKLGDDLASDNGGHIKIDGKDQPPAFFQDLLRDAERKWIAYRQAECNSASEQYETAATGEMSCQSLNYCNALLTKHRTDELTSNYDLGDATNAPATSSNSGIATKIYKNATYGFQFQYPSSMSAGNSGYGYLDVPVVSFQISQQYPKTNFDDAGFAVSASPVKSLSECLAKSSPTEDDKNAFKTKTSINGTDFYSAEGNEGACGNIYESKIYRALSGSQCIELIEVIHTSNIGNFDPGTVKAVDEKPIWKILDQVAASFQFTK